MAEANGSYGALRERCITAMTAAVWPGGEWSAEAETMLDALLLTLAEAHEDEFLGGPEHHCIDQQGCRACAVSQFLRPLRMDRPVSSDDDPITGRPKL